MQFDTIFISGGDKQKGLKMPIILIPAYGRKYATEEKMVEDYLAGKDFKLLSSPYCSCRDFKGQNISLSFGNGRYISIEG